jgi:hypothetical protein
MTHHDDLRADQEPMPELRPAASNAHLTRQEEGLTTSDPETRRAFPELSKDELDRLIVLRPGARLEQGSVYVDLDDLDAGPFVALGSEEVSEGDRIRSKRDTDYEMWNRIVGDREPRRLRPV